MTAPTIGRIVWYQLNEDDAEAVNRRRDHFTAFCGQLHYQPVPGEPGMDGHVAHVGNRATAGDQYPAVIVRTWHDGSAVNLQVHLDGNDCYWATSRDEGTGPGMWAWPERVM